jgi:hypothetical protein
MSKQIVLNSEQDYPQAGDLPNFDEKLLGQ